MGGPVRVVQPQKESKDAHAHFALARTVLKMSGSGGSGGRDGSGSVEGMLCVRENFGVRNLQKIAMRKTHTVYRL